MNWITATMEGVVVNLHVTPRASKTQVQGLHGDTLKVKLQAPPVDGRANEALLAFLAAALDVPRRQITLVSGQTHRHKRVAIQGLSVGEVTRSLMP